MIPDVFSADEAVSVLGSWANDIESASLNEAFQACVPTLHAGFGDNFSGTKSSAGTWPPHAPYTVQKYGPHPLLILSGDMLRSVTSSGAAGSIENYLGRSAEFGTSLFYAGWQQFGTTKIPPRRFLWLDSTWVIQVTEKFADEVFVIFLGR